MHFFCILSVDIFFLLRRIEMVIPMCYPCVLIFCFCFVYVFYQNHVFFFIFNVLPFLPAFQKGLKVLYRSLPFANGPDS